MLIREIYERLTEMAEPKYTKQDLPSAQRYSGFNVDYYAITPSGTRARFQRATSLAQLASWGRSETAVWSWLKRLHPKCDIEIMRLEWK